MANPPINPQLELAFDYIRQTSTSIFLTGKAGTGKTTFLKRVKEEAGKRMVVTAPTGVAAINAGGMTIHSLFQLPLGLFVPNSHRREENRRYSREKLNLIRGMDLLVIDEISMVRADLLDAIDESLRQFRDDARPFGNVQLLMIGDLHQLPPVVKPEDWETLRRYYQTPYFFGSQALRQTKFVSIELKHIYRQSDTVFIELLNKVRENQLDDPTLQLLNRRYIPGFRPQRNESYITLTSTNAVAHQINQENLIRLPGKPQRFPARIEGNFPPSSYPTEETLEFKRGSQVMFIKNDQQPEKRFYNGKIGTIKRMDAEAIYVQCEGESSEIAVTPSEWANVKYSFNEETKEIEEEVLGMFVQFPLKLAWAITIHKSQGLTFERAIIDAQSAFAHGQVYVALSRCKTLQGIVLLSPIEYSSVKTDPVVQGYTEEVERKAPGEAEIHQAKQLFQKQLIEELFSFQAIAFCFSRLRNLYQQHQNTLPAESLPHVSGLARTAYELLSAVSDKFHPQLQAYLESPALPEANAELQTRIGKAAEYFTGHLATILEQSRAIPTQTDNQAVRQSVLAQLENLQLQIFIKQALFHACRNGFSTSAYQRTKFDAEFDFKRSFVRQSLQEAVPADVPHPELYAELLKYRQEMADQNGISPRSVLTSDSLRLLVTALPTTQHAISKIRGIARKRLQKYGSDIERIVRRYCDGRHLSVDPKAASKALAAGTKQISFDMFQAGCSVEQIAQKRSLTVSTIQVHLAHFIALNQLDIHQLLSPAALNEIAQFFSAHPGAKLADAKTFFGDKYEYGTLRLASAHFSASNSNVQTH